MKSPSSMKNGRFNTSKCRGKLQKMGVLYIHSSKRLGPFSKLPKLLFFFKRKKKRMEPQSDKWRVATTVGR
jgi:hypothetical protein